MDADNPGSVTVPDLSAPSISYQYSVRKPISTSSDTIMLCARYRLLNDLTLKGHYAYEDTSRDNADLWDLRDNTNKQTFSLSARADLPKGADLRMEYGFTQYEDPAYNIEPDYSNSGALSLSWMPWPRLLALFSYNITLDKRDFLHYSDTDEARNLEAERNRELVSLTYIVSDGLTVTASFARMHDRTEQDIAYRSLAGATLIDRGVVYEDSNQNVILALDYSSRKKLSLHSEVSYTTSEAAFTPRSQDLLEPVAVDSFSDSEVREVSFGASGEYELMPDLSVGLEYKYADMEEELDNPYDDIDSGGAHFIMLSLSKKWR
jgi:predicted porin